MSTLIIGFDSAWTTANDGAIVAVAIDAGIRQVLCVPRPASFDMAAALIEGWRDSFERVVVMLDQPTVVKNDAGNRTWERIAASPVGKAGGGVQPANRGRTEMFGPHAPVWGFLDRLGAELDPRIGARLLVIETYPVLALLGLDWTRKGGKLPKYNPGRPGTFDQEDWRYLCDRLAKAFWERRLDALAEWCEAGSNRSKPKKSDQDGIDALVCLLVGLRWLEGLATIQIGNVDEGLVVVPGGRPLRDQLETRLDTLNLPPSEWVLDVTMPCPI